jgi:hypothetical protein
LPDGIIDVESKKIVTYDDDEVFVLPQQPENIDSMECARGDGAGTGAGRQVSARQRYLIISYEY